MTALDDLLFRQSGVVSRGQLARLDLGPHDVRRLLRRRDLVRLHPGVYVCHTGFPDRSQLAWGAVLAVWPAALSHQSALEAAGVSAGTDVIHVAIDRDRSPTTPSGVTLHRLARFREKVHWTTSPPRVRVEEAALDVAAAARDELTAIATLADVVRARRTTTARMRMALDGRSRIRRRAFLGRGLQDVEAGTCSVLEHGYLTRVERPHGLPSAARQVCDSLRGTVYRDVVYAEFATYVELDGRLYHDSTRDRDRDLERDLDVAVGGRLTLRLGWGQVFSRPCSTARKLGVVLRARGWPGPLTACRWCDDTPVRYRGVAG